MVWLDLAAAWWCEGLSWYDEKVGWGVHERAEHVCNEKAEHVCKEAEYAGLKGWAYKSSL